MDPGQKTEELKRRRREKYLIILIGLTTLLFTYALIHIADSSNNLPIATNLFVYGLININIILLILLIFLILRNSVKLFFESKSKVVGSRLRTKLIVAFIGFSIIPTFLLFVVAIGFINKSIEGWFAIKVEDSLRDSLKLAQHYYSNTKDSTISGAYQMAARIGEEDLLHSPISLRNYIEDKMRFMALSTVEVFTTDGARVSYSISQSINKHMVPDISPQRLSNVFKGTVSSFIHNMEVGDVVRGAAPIIDSDGRVLGAVVTSYYIPRSLMAKVEDISSTFDAYKQLNILKEPVKASYFTILLLITLVIIFFAIWIGRYIAKEITVPIHELAEGTHAIASGDLDYKIEVESRDEIGTLVKDFNRMTADLKASKSRLEEANLNLRDKNAELEQRRGYIETVLGNVPAGVISIDRTGHITAINKVAEEILRLDKDVLGEDYRAVFPETEKDLLDEMIKEIGNSGVQTLERQIRAKVKDQDILVLVNLTMLQDESGRPLGMVVVLDDLTHLFKVQRMMAWREVAQRIAHEVKNPLTPIQLSAQRLRKKYLDKLPSDKKIFDDCTNTIIKQVEELKTLVNEFSNFARLPKAAPSLNNLNDIVEETITLYKTAHKNILFTTSLDPALPTMQVDRNQMKRVLINLIDNSINAMQDSGEISVNTYYESSLRMARIEVIDDGCGILQEDKGRLFEPYYSTKKSGTGLGLTIAGNIIADHNGFIRIKDNLPKGTRIVIELPTKGVTV